MVLLHPDVSSRRLRFGVAEELGQCRLHDALVVQVCREGVTQRVRRDLIAEYVGRRFGQVAIDRRLTDNAPAAGWEDIRGRAVTTLFLLIYVRITS